MAVEVFWGSGSPFAWSVMLALEVKGVPYTGHLLSFSDGDLKKPALPVRWNDRLVEYLRYFRDGEQGRALMRGWLRRAGRYERRLRKILGEVGVPEDLVFVALAESGFNPRVRSRVGAAGLWQFMEATGNVYGLEQDFWIDERFDVEKSSYAAAAYLADLHARSATDARAVTDVSFVDAGGELVASLEGVETHVLP